MKRAMIFLLTLLLTFTSIACKKQTEKGTLEINFTIAGYGEAYIPELIDAFTKKTGIKVEYTTDDNATNSAIGRISTVKKNTTDIFFTMVSCFPLIDSYKNKGGYENLFMDLSDLYEMEVPGKGKKLKEIVRQDLYEANLTYNIDGTPGKSYIVPWTSSLEGFIANKKALAKYGITELPRTTDEFEELLDLIKSGKTTDGKPVMPADRVAGGITCANNSAYWGFIWPTWWAQYGGVECIDTYFAARPEGATEPYVPDWKALDQEGKLVAIEETYRFLNNANGYMDPACENRDHLQSQVDFLDGKAAFIPSGAWIETETAQDFYKEGADVSFVMMKVPVTSRLGEKLGISEEELRAAIDYADKKTDEKPSFEGKTAAEADEILARVSEARGIVGSILTNQNKAVIPAYTTEKKEAYQFMLFYASDEAQEILIKHGIMSAFGYTSETEESFTEFSRSMFDILNKDNTVLLIPGTRYPMAYKSGLDFTAHTSMTSANKGFENLIFKGTATAQKIYDDELTYFQNRWSQMLVNAGYGRK